ncbi:hypothetical protein PtA15_4A630 [Puccinia triticina]|uniref:Anaphase-promoting complex subunit 4 WD40 domain-containing protein n=1 Tax=Puccinia triticina TaxID=208348 RepID=A0ABY7CIJ4_9BASI|nr:uncharacterized protein PtA15_4A630 [Puccinia triticina]WAQ84178.1 hypothetical protein PtA15_4A630 [Puccinia triticina]
MSAAKHTQLTLRSDYRPATITAITSSPATWKPAPAQRATIAIGRANGDIELWIWPTSSPPSLHRTLPGHLSRQTPAKVEHLLFTHQFIADQDEPDDRALASTPPRLLGTNGADELLELAIGCDDGAIRIAAIAHNQLELIRKLDPCNTRLLSLAWGFPPPETPLPLQEPPDSQLFLVAGGADSSLRKWAAGSGRCLNRMTVEKLQGEHTLVWTVAVLNGTIISGDSVGNVHFWDAKSCVRRQTIRAHRADILCMVPSPDGCSLFTSGVDQKTCQLTLHIQSHPASSNKTDQSRWLLAASRRLHSHDVRALDSSPPYNPLLTAPQDLVPVLLSGGLDMSLVLCPAATLSSAHKLRQLANPVSDSSSVAFADALMRKISYATTRDPVAALSPLARLLVSRNATQISIWRLRPQPAAADHPPEPRPPRKKKAAAQRPDDPEAAWTKVVEMDLKCRTNLVASAISPDGRWLAVSDLYEAKLFALVEAAGGMLQPRRVKAFEAFAGLAKGAPKQGARSIEFSPDSTRLVLAASLSSDIVLLDLAAPDSARPQVATLAVFPLRPPPLDCLGNQAGPHTPLITPHASSSYILKIAVSPDGQWLATADSQKTLRVYNLDAMKVCVCVSFSVCVRGEETDERGGVFLQPHCSLTMPEAEVTCMAFPAPTPSTVVVGFATNALYVVDVETRMVPGWATDLGGRLAREGLRELREPVLGLEFAPLLPGPGPPTLHARLWGVSWIAAVVVPLPLDLPTPLRSLSPPSPPPAKKRRTDSPPDAVPPSVRLARNLHNVLRVAFLDGPHTSLVLLRPFFDLLHAPQAALPPVWQRTGAYGT